jgi:hypothetical protein
MSLRFKGWQVFLFSQDEVNENGYYKLDARCGHNHQTEAAAQACLDKLQRRFCWDNKKNNESGKCASDHMCAKCDHATLLWDGAVVQKSNTRPRPK